MKRVVVFSFLIMFTSLLSASTVVVIDENGDELKVKGNFPTIGQKAPTVRVVSTDMSVKTIGGKSDKIRIIATVPTVDTPICTEESKRFDNEIKKISNVDMTVVSMDPPYSDDRFCEGRGIKNISVGSDFEHRDVGSKYGVVITAGESEGLLIRSIFVIGKDGKVLYEEIVSELTLHPNYDNVMNVIKMANSKK